MRLFVGFIVVIATLLASVPAEAADLREIVSGLDVLPLRYGVNKVRASGMDILVTRGRFQTETASTRDLYTVLALQDGVWQWVRFDDPLDKSGSIIMETWPHASEDSLVGFRFMKSKKTGKSGEDLYLLRINRKLELGYSASPAVFTLFRLRHDEDFGILTFQAIATLAPKTKYCNADWAAHQELGLPLRKDNEEFACEEKASK